MDAKISKKILELAQDQKAEIEEDEWVDDDEDADEPLNGYVLYSFCEYLPQASRA